MPGADCHIRSGLREITNEEVTMSEQRGQRVVGWAVGCRSAWIEVVHEDGKPTGFVVRTRDRELDHDEVGSRQLGEFCFARSEAETLAKTFVAWAE